MTLPTQIPENATPAGGMRSFYIIWLGELISILGSGLTGFALAVNIYQKTHQATPFALTVLFGTLPTILLLPVAGSLADRWNRRWIMILADTGAALATLGAALILFFGDLQIWHIYLISAVEAVCAAFQEPAYTASITMLVPKKELTRASGMVQMGQALQSIVTPLIAGFVFVAIGMQGVILIDFATYFFAIAALLIVHIPQPEIQTETGVTQGGFRRVLSDTSFGWKYLRARPGLLGLLGYIAMVNFLLNFSSVLSGPLILARNPASVLGIVQMVAGISMLLGGIAISVWGGPKQGRRIPLVIGMIGVSMTGLVVTGIQPQPLFICAGLFIMIFFVPIATGLNQAVWQTKVAPDVQGRIFSIKAMISRSMMPLAFLIAGPLADHFFEPMLRSGGALANTFIGRVLQSGPGRGIGLMFVLSGLVGVIVTILVYANKHIRLLEDEIPDSGV